MPRILAVGVPTQIRSGFVRMANGYGELIGVILCELGKEGQSYRLLPHPAAAIHHLRTFFDGDMVATSYDEATVLVLPYVEVPEDVAAELEAFRELGARVVYATAGEDGWPDFPKGKKNRTERFFDAVIAAARKDIFLVEPTSASDIFAAITAHCPRIIVTRGALESCDEIAACRIPFIRDAALAFVEYVDAGGPSGRIDAYFRSKGLEHAQTGGVETKLLLTRGGQVLYERTSHTHLKKGDKTTPQAAARIYYHALEIDDAGHFIAVLYAGPHPDRDIVREHSLD